ncbi:hypothetical protein RUM44_013896 [Polyplax serrata]|uniref:UDP-N-acetylglucosamine--dolichyl-phosphate N-acetylglucosaminephosphotransferase n=1 Tax=Polyplax serrata TaxID=468196 RepID=A0ABR1BK53_POLSC
MTFAVVGILGHFSKTMLLFFIPQVFNFIYSLLQLLKYVPCPRHRMPRLNAKSGYLEPSVAVIRPDDMKPGLHFVLNLLKTLKLLEVRREGQNLIVNNMTLINLTLLWTGPLHEAKLTTYLLYIQADDEVAFIHLASFRIDLGVMVIPV